MTEDNNPKPMKKTSAVPLRKETVRVTLKANPSDNGNSGAADSPPAPAPTISLKAPASGPPAVPPPAPTTPTPPRAPKAPPTVKLQTAPNPVAAPTVAASSFAGAKNLVPPPKPSTLKIASPDFDEPKATDSAVPEPAPTVGLATPGTDQPAGASSQPLPKATVQIQPSQAMPTQAEGSDSLLSTVSVEDPEEAAAQRAEGTATVLSAVALVAAVIVLGIQLGTANIWVNDETHESPGWGRLFD